MRPYDIVLADDHILLRQGIKKIVEESEDLRVVGEASDGLELLGVLKEVIPDMVILDISMPGLRGIEATSEIKMIHPEVKVLILTMHRRKEYLRHALSAGADGYLLKEDTGDELLSAIETVRQGGVYLSGLLSKYVTEDFVQMCRGEALPPEVPLTTREREVLKLIAEGKSNQEVADLLFISVRTVHHHRTSIMAKLQLRKVADLVRYAIREGYASEIT